MNVPRLRRTVLAIGLICSVGLTQQANGTIAQTNQPTPARRMDRPKNSEVEKPKPTKSSSRPWTPTAGTYQPPSQTAQQAQAAQQQSSAGAGSAVSVDLLAQNQPLILRTEAFAGEPYGVGKLTFRLRMGDEMIHRVGAALLTDSENRIFYPVVSKSAVKTFFQTVTGSANDQPDDVHTVWFLFKGQDPLKLAMQGSGGTAFEIPVEFARTRQFDRRVRQWWDSYNRVINAQIEQGDYPPLVETYLKSLLGKRMGLEVSGPARRSSDPLMKTFELMFDVEALRSETIRNSMLNGVTVSVADKPLPDPIRWTPVVVENLPAEIGIEPIAKCVPEECFYLRFGTWENQLWLQQLMEEFGGDLSQMIQVRGFKYKIQSKFLNQLAIQSSEWDKLFGGNLIDDVAVIGSDTYFNEGSSVGVLLHAKSTKRLESNLRSKRKAFAKSNKKMGVSIVNIPFDIGGDKSKRTSIEFLSTPDNRYRSFYVVSGDCHLMTTSLKLAQRFLESGAGIRSLADSAEYRFARYNMPLEREDTIFVYLSTRFFQELLSPQYQIELRRRNRIVTDIVMLEMANMAAANERYPDMSLEGLKRGGFLPDGFGYRPDQGNVETVDGKWQDSVRGQRGFFAPIPDVPLTAVTAEEADWFQERSTFFTDSIRSLDPMFVAIKRFNHKDKIERVVIDARVAPFGEEKYGWLISMLGQPLEHEVGSNPSDVIRFEASMRGGSTGGRIPPHQIFAAVQDRLDPTVDLRPSSFLRALETLKEAPGYLGAWPNPGYTNWMPALGREPDEYGYTYSRLLKLFRLQWEEFSVLSFDQNRLEALKPHLKVVPSERPAQLRLIVGDLANSNLSSWANSVNFRRGWQTSIANVRLLNLLTQQFRVTPEAAKIIVERMLDVELVCSLGGDYKLVSLPSKRMLWYSDAWPSFSTPSLPDQHRAPLLKWFRGLEVEVMKAESQFAVHAILDIERKEVAKSLPTFDLFGGFGSIFGGGKKEGGSKSNSESNSKAKDSQEPKSKNPLKSQLQSDSDK
ncbi:MAG: hypothetical protein AB8B55_12940 [Mariniblastus sp.]